MPPAAQPVPMQSGGTSMLTRTMPHNVEAEQAVIGSVLLDNLAFTQVIEIVGPEDFYREANHFIFEAIASLSHTNTPVDLLTLTDELKRRSRLDAVGGPVYLQQCADAVPTAAHAEHYARMVREKAILRSIIHAGTDIVQLAYADGRGESDADIEGNEVDNLLDEAEHKIFSIAEKRVQSTVMHMRDVVKASFAHIEQLTKNHGEVTGVATGYDDLDRLTAGLQPADLVILAARPSVGKTALALNIARNAAVLNGDTTLVFSLEMSKEALALRMFSAEAHIDSSNLRRGFIKDHDHRKLTQAASVLQDAPLFIDDTASPSVLEIKAKARRIKAEHGLGLVIIDYLQLVKPRTGRDRNREQEIADISRSFKAMAKELNVPVLALAQLNRAPEQRPDARPRLADLRESGAIEQDADVILFLYREDMYKKESERNADAADPAMSGPPPAELIIGKQRNGPTGTVFLTFLKEYTRFESYSYRSEAPPLDSAAPPAQTAPPASTAPTVDPDTPPF